MATNKNAQLRYQVLDRCFRNKLQNYTIDDLLEEVNEKLYDVEGPESQIQIRQLRADINHLRDRETYNAPIKTYPGKGKACFYRYSDPDFSIFRTEMSDDELVKLRSTIEMLGRFRGSAENAWLEEVISNLEHRFHVQPNTESVVSFEQNDKLKGLEHLSALINAAVAHQPLEIVYRTYKGTELTQVIHPYHIKQFNNRWFMFGCEENEYGRHIANRALDRIVSFRHADVRFIPNKDVDFNTYFDDVIGVTIPRDDVNLEEVVLKFDDKRFPYVVSKPLHRSQETLNEEEHTIVIKVRPNKELEAQIMSYGPQVEVLSPAWLREQISSKIQEAYQHYHK